MEPDKTDKANNTCKLAYAADGTLICDPKTSKNIQGIYLGTPTCGDDCNVYGKRCVQRK